jgi:hypothetical protein
MSVLPEYVGARERRVAAKVDLHIGRKPAKIIAIKMLQEKSRFRQIHFPGYVLQPLVIAKRFKDADRGRVPSKGLVRKSVNLNDRNGHKRRYSSAVIPAQAGIQNEK